MRRKEPVSEIPFPPKFDVAKWDSNEKFEKHLQQRKISKNALGHQDIPMGHKRKPQSPTDLNLRSRGHVNDQDYDTPL